MVLDISITTLEISEGKSMISEFLRDVSDTKQVLENLKKSQEKAEMVSSILDFSTKAYVDIEGYATVQWFRYFSHPQNYAWL